jgi:pilus assembly protein CpaE
MIALVEFDELTAGTIRAAISADIQRFPDVAELKPEVMADQRIEAVILGSTVDQKAALELASAIRTKRPEVGVILIRPRLDTTIVTEAIRAGVRDVISDRDMTQLNGAVKRCLAVTREMVQGSGALGTDQHRGQVITVFSAKGGCGKTTVSTNLACYLAATAQGTVALVDLDLAFGDVCIAMQVQPRHSIADAVAMGDQIDATGLLSMLEHHKSGVHVLSAPPTPDLAEKVHESVVREVLDVLAAHYDYVVIDTAPAMDGTTLAAFDASDTIVMLTTLDIPSLKNAKISLETMRVLGYPESRMRLVLNRADSQVGLKASDVHDALGLPLVGALPSSREVPASTNNGEVLSSSNPSHPFSIALAEFADHNLIAASADEAMSAAASTKRRRSLFGRKS